MKRIIYILLLIIVSINLNAQKSTNINLAKPSIVKSNVIDAKSTSHILLLANRQMTFLKYAYAIPLFKNYLHLGGKKDTIALKGLGFSYKMVNQYDSAMLYYSKAKEAGAKMNNNIAELAAQLGNYKKATNEYELLNSINKNILNDTRIFGFSNIDKFYADSLDYHIYNTKLNSQYNEFNAVPYKGGLVFESNRVITRKKHQKNKIVSPEFAWDGAGYSNLYYIEKDTNIRVDSKTNFIWNDKFIIPKLLSNGTSNDTRLLEKTIDYNVRPFKHDSSIKLFSKRLGFKFNTGSISFTKDGKTAYYTRNGSWTKQGYLLQVWEAKLIKGKWLPTGKLFFNKSKYNYFHPAITPDGTRLYYVSDEPNGFGGTDIYYIDKNEDGSWKPTSNAGQDINTSGNELFPTFYENGFYFSSNGHPGLGGIDIFKLVKDARGELKPKNVGYPINSDKDDFSFSIVGNSGYFSSNRYGSDDIFTFDYAPVFIQLDGLVTVDSVASPGKKVYLTWKNEIGKMIVMDSAVVDDYGSYSFNARPNKEYTIVTYKNDGQKYETLIKTNNFIKRDSSYKKQIALINIPLTDTELLVKRTRQSALIAQQKASQAAETLNRMFAKTVDSLMQLSKDYVELHHPFDQVYIIKKDLIPFDKLINRIKGMNDREIVIVSATDCNGTEEYNENLSERRSKHIFKTISKLSNNHVIIKHVGERELLKACEDVKKSIEEQEVNRYSYVFIMEKK